MPKKITSPNEAAEKHLPPVEKEKSGRLRGRIITRAYIKKEKDRLNISKHMEASPSQSTTSSSITDKITTTTESASLPLNSKDTMPALLSLSPNMELVHKKRMADQQLYLEAITLNPKKASAYLALGTTLEGSENILLPTGQRMNAQQLFIEAITLDPQEVKAYKALETTLVDSESILLPDGQTMTKQQLLQYYLSLIS